MLVPQYWAEASVCHRHGNKQVTVRRFGWSDSSQTDAQQHAEQRAQDAMARIQSGEPLLRREPKRAYNGADGVPIREEIINRVGDTIITRNGYGALCLNTPNVLFADVDFALQVPVRWLLVIGGLELLFALLLATVAGWGVGLVAGVLGLLLAYPLANALYKVWLGLGGGPEQQARTRIDRFSAAHPDWHLRLYRTPAGFRVLAMHRLFDPVEPAVADSFAALGTDPLYQQMCRHQRCFRARVSPKPWRIGLARHLRPRPGIWPVSEAGMALRQQWVADYNRLAERFAACHFVGQLGSQTVHPDALSVQRLHDELCRAGTPLPLA